MADEDWYKPDRPPAPARQAQAGELLFEFHVAATDTFYRVELRDHRADISRRNFSIRLTFGWRGRSISTWT